MKVYIVEFVEYGYSFGERVYLGTYSSVQRAAKAKERLSAKINRDDGEIEINEVLVDEDLEILT